MEKLIIIDEDIFNNFDKKRQEGENDSYICSLIRGDSFIEFISYVNFQKISLSGKIERSIFETNSFLIDHITKLRSLSFTPDSICETTCECTFSST